MIHKSAKAWLPLLFLGAAGCATIADCCIEQETSMRNCVLAQKAWGNWSWCYDDLDHPFHFAKGFKAGYKNILEGGKGCQPTLPPRWYWKPCYQSPEGRCKIASWFDGYSHGALAAQQDGYGSLQELPISPTARANWVSQFATPNPACFDGMYHGQVPGSPDSVAPEGAIIPEDAPMDGIDESVPGDAQLRPEGSAGGAINLEPLRPYDDSVLTPEQ
jgi:hypothetical protein